MTTRRTRKYSIKSRDNNSKDKQHHYVKEVNTKMIMQFGTIRGHILFNKVLHAFSLLVLRPLTRITMNSSAAHQHKPDFVNCTDPSKNTVKLYLILLEFLTNFLPCSFLFLFLCFLLCQKPDTQSKWRNDMSITSNNSTKTNTLQQKRYTKIISKPFPFTLFCHSLSLQQLFTRSNPCLQVTEISN